MKTNENPPLFLSFLSLLHIFLSFQPISATEFLFNGFEPSNISLYGIAQLESNILTLTNMTSFSIGRALYPSKIRTRDPNSSRVLPFSTSFVFSMAPKNKTLPGHGIVFLFVPYTGVQKANPGQHLGFLNRTNNGNDTNHVFGVEFDVFDNEEFNDLNDNHVGIDLNSLKSTFSHDAGYYGVGGDEKSFRQLKLNNGKNYQVWIDYADFQMNVTMAIAGMERPSRPLLNVSLNLSQVFEDEMYVGFTAATGQLVQSHRILAWSFSNSNFSLSDELVTTGLPSFEPPEGSVFRSKGFIAGVTVGIFVVFVACCVVSAVSVKRKRRREREREEMEEWELEYWPHRITYLEIESATKGFSEENVIGIGGNGKVYKGVLAGGAEVAVKRISHENNEGVREFLAEISSLGRLKHRNLVGLRGWCKKERGSLVLVYDYMENGSLDKRVYECDEREMLSCEDRIRVLKDVASGVLYLHEGWESKVLHRDIKASNALLDKDMNGKLGDFGLARMHGHSQVASTTRVVGTVGYLAPEVVRSGRASSQTDVFGFGTLILEVMCGRRPIEEGKANLVDWVWELMGRGELVQALDERLRRKGGFDDEEVDRVLHLGLLCAYPDPQARPTMRQVVKVLEGKNEVDVSEGDDMDVYLLEKMKSKGMWSKYPHSFGNGLHPTFDQIKDSVSSSILSLSWSDAIVDGR
ncbi:L-type lectin-domain containing receptor kinase VII.1-like [Actinidia eriantha]|uniref:L-type lectin-domain containing receptor kinase VII.1-like n=1 Tax=Actinidia eriantha TaxID=165200 RepID=UPI0025868FD3|nr:L-type lectin-domain containing receptor kinase VII.1-like [Actinidia eriantha]